MAQLYLMLRGTKEKKKSLYIQVETKNIYMLSLITDLITQLRWLGQMTVRACVVLQ